MVRYSKQNKTSEQTQSDALQVARSTQKPGQTKAQTKLIEQGIRKGIEVYKQQQKAKLRELDKRLKKAAASPLATDRAKTAQAELIQPVAGARLPWVLLALSWAVFGGFVFVAW